MAGERVGPGARHRTALLRLRSRRQPGLRQEPGWRRSDAVRQRGALAGDVGTGPEHREMHPFRLRDACVTGYRLERGYGLHLQRDMGRSPAQGEGSGPRVWPERQHDDPHVRCPRSP